MGIDGSRFEALFAAAVANGDLVGGVAIAANADGVLLEQAFGANTAGGEPVVIDQPFRIASMTKALTTTGVLQLVEQGKLALDDEVAAIIPAFGDLQVLDGFDGDTPRLRAPASQATVRQLLNHTAGLGYEFLNADLARYLEVTGTPGALSFEKRLLEAPLVNDPGTAWEYGTNTDWAGQVVETVSGQTLDAYLKEHLFGPLGMTSTTFLIEDAQAARLMPVHSRIEDGSLVPNGIELPSPPEMCSGGGGSYSTAPDYIRFLRAILRGGELDGARVLEPASVELMLTASLGDLPLPEVMRTANPLLCNDVVSPPVPQSWGLGFHLMLADLPGMRHAGTGDWAGLTNCYYWVDRTAGVCGVMLTQAFPFFDERIVGTALQFEGGVYAETGAATTA
jgi:CubicO group peptidase (beta-lactamase class C family)